MKAFFLALFTQLSTITDIQYIRMWNNQLEWMDDGKMYLFPIPAIFIEFHSTKIEQLVGGSQYFNPLIFKIHILHWQLDAADGTFEQNLDVYDLKDKVFACLQKFQPNDVVVNPQLTGLEVGQCIRTAEYQDYKHAGVYHYIMEFATTLTDTISDEPVNGSLWIPDPMPVEIDLTIKDSQDPNEPYTFNFTPAP